MVRFWKSQDITEETVLYAGRNDNQHHKGVAIILKKGLEKYLLEWKPINSRQLERFLCNNAGGGLAMSFERKVNPSQRQHYTGHLKGGASVAVPRIHGDVQ